MLGLYRTVVIVGVVALAGCGDSKVDDESAGSDTTGTVDDPEAFCAQFTTMESCSYADEAQALYCGWEVITTVAIEEGACVLGEPTGQCLPLTGNSTALGCAPSPGCGGEPFWIDLEPQIGVYLQCGGSGPVGGEPCTYVSPGVFEPPECACLCDEATDGSSSGGSTSGTSSTG